MRIQYLGHSAFLIVTGQHSLLFDPFITGNPSASKKPEEIKATHIFVSHAHGDHLGDTVKIAKSNNSKVYTTFELARMLDKEPIKFFPGNIGGIQKTEFGSVKLVAAVHGSGVPGGIACGFVVEAENVKVYFAGDTALTTDMSLLADEGITLALLPIGGLYTMGPEDAVRAVKMIKPDFVIPMHYDTFPAISQDPAKFKSQVESQTNTKVILLKPDEIFELPIEG
ncbi:MAG TPA: metal-dependent hydrolase [Clostridiaceae bacterium]|nr:metal-dependent hydrolase [Clostridiaceae bacterium]